MTFPKILICLLILCWPYWPIFRRGITARDANVAFNSFNSAFYSQNGTNGYFKDTQTGESLILSQAEEIECVIDTYEWKPMSKGEHDHQFAEWLPQQ